MLPSSNCPPVCSGTFRASPTIMDDAAKHAKDDAQNHAVKFFNFMIRRCFQSWKSIFCIHRAFRKKRSRTSSAYAPTDAGVLTSDSPPHIYWGFSCARLPINRPIVRTNTGPRVINRHTCSGICPGKLKDPSIGWLQSFAPATLRLSA